MACTYVRRLDRVFFARQHLMKYESFDRIEIVPMQDEFRARWVFGVSGYHKRNSTLQVNNFDRPNQHFISMTCSVNRVLHTGPFASPLVLGRGLRDAFTHSSALKQFCRPSDGTNSILFVSL